MIEQEVLYERNMTGSYMKIEASGTASFDERMLFSGKIPGILPAEQCFLNGKAWYWYQISGKQSLDTYCKVQDIGIALVEKIIISICDEIDILEWNLFDLNCLLLSPEYIFINNINQEVLFTVYPGSADRLSDQFRDLMEYLLTKIDHKDMKAVKAAYDIYEKTLDEAYDIMEIRNYIVEGRTKEDEKAESEKPVSVNSEYVRKKASLESSVVGELAGRKSAGESSAVGEVAGGELAGEGFVQRAYTEAEESGEPTEREEKKGVFTDLLNILNDWRHSIQRVKKTVTSGKEDNLNGSYASGSGPVWMGNAQRPLQVAEHIAYGRSKDTEGRAGAHELDFQAGVRSHVWGPQGSAGSQGRETQAGSEWHIGDNAMMESAAGQTTVLSGYGDFVKGVLVYEGNDGLENISLQQRNVQIGKSNSSDVCIPRNTISQYHAKISYKDGEYLLEDLNSTNGTYVNEKALAYKEVRKLAMNDMVRFADVSYRFV